MINWIRSLFGSTPYTEQPVKHLPWSDEDKVFVMETKLPIGEVADKLGRSPDAIRSMRKRLKAASE